MLLRQLFGGLEATAAVGERGRSLQPLAVSPGPIGPRLVLIEFVVSELARKRLTVYGMIARSIIARR